MRLSHTILVATILTGTALLVAASPRLGADQKAQKAAVATVGQAAPEFTLTGVDGKIYNLADYKGNTVVIEWICSSCPASGSGASSYWGSGTASKTVTEMKTADAGAVYLTIDSTKDGHQGKTSAEEGSAASAVISKAGQSVPVLLDPDGKIGHSYGAKTTPHIFIVNGTGTVAYIGAPTNDDGSTNYIVNAVTAIKAGKPVEPSTTKNKGCGVKYASK